MVILLDVAEEYAASYPIQSLIKDGLILKILFMNVYGCPLDLIVSPGKSHASSLYYTAPRINQRKINETQLII